MKKHLIKFPFEKCDQLIHILYIFTHYLKQEEKGVKSLSLNCPHMT